MKQIWKIACFALLLTKAAAHATGIGASPSSIQHHIYPDKNTLIRGKITVTLQGTAEANVKIIDWMRNSDGELVLLPPGTFKKSLYPWLQLHQNKLISKGGTTTLSYYIKIPPHAEGSYHSAILIEPTTAPRTQVLPGLWIKHQLVLLIPIDLYVKGTEAPALSLSKVQSLDEELTFLIVNTGNVAINVKALLQGLNVNGEIIDEFILLNEELLPGEGRQLKTSKPTGAITRLVITAPEIEPIIWEGTNE